MSCFPIKIKWINTFDELGVELHVSAFYEANFPEATSILIEWVRTFQLFFVIGVALGKETSFVVVADKHGIALRNTR